MYKGMNEAQARTVDNLRDMFATEGWKKYLEDVETKVNAIKEELTNPEIPENVANFGRGRIAVYRELLTFERLVDQFVQQAAEDKDEAEAQDG